jgi:phage anti-repressor protein
MSAMTNLNIVELIENNPISNLSNTYQNKLLTKIKNSFKNEEQRLFVASFYSYLNYNVTKDFVIDLDTIWKWLGFNQKYNAKRVLEKFFIADVDYINMHESNINKESDEKKHGGHNKETYMLSVNTFKRLCLKSETNKADQFHNYYIKLEEILHEVLKEESNEFKLKLVEAENKLVQTEQSSKKTIEQLHKEKTLERHNVLLQEFANAGAIVYVIKVKTYENGEYIVKIGESRRGIEGRYNEHKTHHEEAILLDCFSVKRSRDFENFLHNHKDIKLNQVTTLPGHERERELFLIGKNLTYNILLRTIKQHIKQFDELDYGDISNDIKSIKNILSNTHQSEILEDKNTIKQLMDNQTLMLQKISSLERSVKDLSDKLNATQTRTTTGFEQPLTTLGPRLQKINPETMTIVNVYETVTECMREDMNMKRPSITKAVEENTVYNGHRWALVDRELDASVLHNLPPTKQTKAQNLGYIAKLNATKTQILNVYLDRKTAALHNGYQSSSALDTPVKNGSITNGHYYMLYEKCEDVLRGHFEAIHNGEPLLYKEGVGQYGAQNNLVSEFACKYDCIRSLRISDKTLAKALDKSVLYNGHYYRSIGSKLSL